MIDLLLAARLLAPVQLPPQWANWKYARAIATRNVRGEATIVVPPSLYANADPSLRDIRIIDAGGESQPFAIVTPPGGGINWTEARLIDRGYVAGRYTQAVAALATTAAPYGLLDIETGEPNFARRVDIDASDDGIAWRTIRTGAPIYDYAADGLATNTSIAIPATTARYLRVRVLGEPAFDIGGVRIAAPQPSAPRNERYALRTTETPGAAKTTVLLLDGIDEVPISRLSFDVATAAFARDIEIESSSGGDWQMVAQGSIARSAGGTASTALDFPETQAQRWRVVIHNGDDAALQGVRVIAYGAPRRIDFNARPGSGDRLIYGNAAAAAPSFDYATAHPDTQSLPAVALGPPMLNAGYVAAQTRPWSERYPALIWIVLGAVVVGIAALSIRTMR